MKRNGDSGWKYDGAFVIQFSPETDLASGRCSGRVEHVASYDAVRFHSLDGLLDFLSNTLERVRSERERN